MPGFPDLTALEPGVLLLVAAVLVFLQAALLIGIFIPGGKAAFLTGLTASLGHLSLWSTYASIATALVAGSSLGFWLGRRHGPRILEHRVLAKRQARVAAAQGLLQRRLLLALVVGRYVAVLRATLPSLAGAAGIGHRRFQVGNVLGALPWAALWVGTGFLVGSSVLQLSKHGPATWIGAALVAVVIAATVLVVRRRSAAVRPAD